MNKKTKEVINFINKHYCEAENPMSQKELAEKLGISVGGLKNLLYRYGLSKKNHYKKLKKDIIGMHESGMSVNAISVYTNKSTSYIYQVLNNKEEETNEMTLEDVLGNYYGEK